ncbi:MAG: four helix bundle protein [Gemmatimonadetes bacterium]|nr:MAG: four helix bundle protein [Gemmatimonadota bacterium]
MGDFKELRAWQEAKELAVLSKAAIAKLPRDERYALGDQWRRAAYSVGLNLAEGASRRGPTEFRRYLDIARSSLHELEAIFELATAQGYVPDSEMKGLQVTRANCARMVYGLLRKMSDRSR